MTSFATEELATVVAAPASSFLPRRYFPGDVSAWAGHIPFANDLVGAIRPSLLVELGTHWGESYFTMCQSVQEHELPTLCYAVDTWVGEEHSGFYDESVFQDVSIHNLTHYQAFSYLLRTTFDEARGQFADETIDLLHIDGLHTYDAVSHDFRGWLPKVRPGGIVLLHDVSVRHGDFGVWRLWEEMQAEFSETFTFTQWWGLGVLRKPGGKRREPFLDLLFNGEAQAQERIRRHYFLYSNFLETTLRPVKPAPPPPVKPQVQVYPPTSAGFSEETSCRQGVDFEGRQSLTFEFPQGNESGGFRIDPADCPCVVEIFEVGVIGEAPIWTAKTPEELRALEVNGSAGLLTADGAYKLLSYGVDPHINLPTLAPHAGPLRVTISLRLTQDFSEVWRALKAVEARTVEALAGNADAAAKLAAMEQGAAASQRDAETVRTELQSERAAAQKARSEAETFRLEADQVRLEVEKMRLDAETARAELKALGDEKELLQTAYGDLGKQLAAEQAMLAAERATRAAMEQSTSWKITKPLRRS